MTICPNSRAEKRSAVNDVEEAAAAQSFRVPPLQDSPLAVRKEVFANADHLGRVKSGLEHCSNSLAAVNRAFGYLMVDRVRMIEGGEGINVGAVERINPSQHGFPRGHGSHPLRRNCNRDTAETRAGKAGGRP